ncbi:hypothetical protein KSP39_PZI017716 [Platanthera zijinensis]|uniref:Transposase (putative) gypsy type domain-containing protein n=1 Tax=Platanthera zijinensis TaxID=2320716 RepID=A0AAP0G077_9ASPA
MSGETEGRSKCAQTFLDHSFLPCRLTQEEYLSIVENFISPEFVARNPGNKDRVNLAPEGELAIALEHFEVGFRLPLWPEVRQALRYYGIGPAQLNPNSVAILITFACYMRAEMVEFSLLVFRKLFNFRSKNRSVFFSGQSVKTGGLANKNHHWAQRFVFVSGTFGNIPLAPIQYNEAAYKPPALGGERAPSSSSLGRRLLTSSSFGESWTLSCQSLPTKVPFVPMFATLRHRSRVLIAKASAGEREIPHRQPFDEARDFANTLALAKSAAQAC